jgi:alpha-L-fucosidase
MWPVLAATASAAAACAQDLATEPRLERPGLREQMTAVVAGAASPAPETPAQRDARMAWWRDARFGIFIHWGVYSRLEGRWDGKDIPSVGEWIMETGKIPASAYVREARAFNPTAYDPASWAALFRDAGAKYVVITSRHHDGFCLWDSKVSDFDVMGVAAGRDLLAPLKREIERQGLKFGLYYSIMDWTHPDWSGRRAWNDLWPGRAPDRAAFDAYIDAQLRELAAAYDPAVVWFDGEWEDPWTVEEGARTQALTRALMPHAIVNDRCVKARPGMRPRRQREQAMDQDVGDFGTPEQEVPRKALPDVDWETCLTMNDTWGYKASDTNFKSTRELIRTLVDVSSKGGNLLLNVGPDGLGRIPEPSIQRLHDLGAWLKVNGEAIYATRAGPIQKLSWGRSTQRDGVIYLHVFDWPRDGRLPLPGLKTTVKKARVVGHPDLPVRTLVTEEQQWLEVPGVAPSADATVIALEIDGPPVMVAPPPEKLTEGTIVLGAGDARLAGGRLGLEQRDADKQNIGYWTDGAATASWSVTLPASTLVDVVLVLSCLPGAEGNDFQVDLGDQHLRGTVRSTGSWEEFEPVTCGRLRLGPGTIDLTVRAADPRAMHFALMNLQEVRLVPVKGTR